MVGCRFAAPVGGVTSEIAVIADAWFPAPWPRLKRFAPAPTVDLTIHFRAELPHQGLAPDAFVLAADTVVAVGRRKHGDAADIYALARKLLKQRLVPVRTQRGKK